MPLLCAIRCAGRSTSEDSEIASTVDDAPADDKFGRCGPSISSSASARSAFFQDLLRLRGLTACGVDGAESEPAELGDVLLAGDTGGVESGCPAEVVCGEIDGVLGTSGDESGDGQDIDDASKRGGSFFRGSGLKGDA